MEYENKYASKGMAGTALGFGIGAVGMELLKGFLGGNCGGGHGGGHGERGPLVDRFELGTAQRIATLESQNAMLQAEASAQRRFGIAETQIAHLQDAVCCLKGELARTNERFEKITMTVIPASMVWTAPATP